MKKARPITWPVSLPEPHVDVDHIGDWLMRLVPRAPGLSRTTEALDELFAETPPERLVRLDATARVWSRWDDSSWRALTPQDVTALAARQPGSTVILAALSMHPNGYVREAAVRGLVDRDLEMRGDVS